MRPLPRCRLLRGEGSTHVLELGLGDDFAGEEVLGVLGAGAVDAAVAALPDQLVRVYLVVLYLFEGVLGEQLLVAPLTHLLLYLVTHVSRLPLLLHYRNYNYYKLPQNVKLLL